MIETLPKSYRTASQTRVGICEGSPANFNSLEYVTIATTGSVADFGDATTKELHIELPVEMQYEVL